ANGCGAWCWERSKPQGVRKNPLKNPCRKPNKTRHFEWLCRFGRLSHAPSGYLSPSLHPRSDDSQSGAGAPRDRRPLGCEIVRVYKDHGISGAKGRDNRPAFDRLCRDAARREFDMALAWSVDRLGRSLQDLVGFLSELHALKIDLFLRQQGLDARAPAGKAMFQMMGVFAEFERAMVQERVRAGLARARGGGKRLGRPPDSPGTGKTNP